MTGPSLSVPGPAGRSPRRGSAAAWARRVAALLAVALLLPAGLSAASAGGPLHLTATSIRTGPDAGQMTAPLAVLVMEDHPLQGSVESPPPVPPFVVHAISATIESDQSTVGVKTPLSGHSVLGDTATANYTQARLEQAEYRAQYRIFVVPAPGHPTPTVTVSEGCLEVKVTDTDRMERTAMVDVERPPLVVNLANGTLVGSCGKATVTVTGWFRLRLWEVDVLLATEEQNQLLRSGRGVLLPPESPVSPTVRDTELYVTVEGTFQSLLPREAMLYTLGAKGELDGGLTLTQVHGLIPSEEGEVEAGGRAVELRGGRWEVQVVGHGRNPMELMLLGDWRAATVGGEVVQPDQLAQSAPAAPPLLLLVGALALAWRSRARKAP